MKNQISSLISDVVTPDPTIDPIIDAIVDYLSARVNKNEPQLVQAKTELGTIIGSLTIDGAEKGLNSLGKWLLRRLRR